MFARLEDAFRRVSQFTADASHELRTPLAIIRTAAELARRRPRTEAEYIIALDRILLESERTTKLIDDLLLLARADAGTEPAIREPIDLAVVVSDACDEGRMLADAAGLRFICDTLPGCWVAADAQALRRLLLILFDNAVKYTPAGGTISVTMSLNRTDAVVEVRDTGIGIADAHLPHLFERFYRVSPDRSRSTGGIGLGLSIARWIAASHGGEIVVESQVGAGSVFRVRLPIVEPNRLSPSLQTRLVL
jgi:signal transduction histidine kinase